jgi:2',3'-cyclic-nucleotide 2'-phosphodiesterase/3'-nucleotidase
MRPRAALAFCFLLSACLSAEEVTITVLATTDLHGNIYPYDYYTAKPADRGLAKIATLIRRERQDNPNNILIDCGDTIQGTPLEYVYQHWQETGKLPLDLPFTGAPLTADPMMLAMNALGYDAMVAGNHDFNFGLKNQMAARRLARFPWISANTKTEPGAAVSPADAPPFAPWLVKTVAGVKVAIIGITTPGIPMWDPPEHYKGYRFEGGRAAAEEAVARLKATEHPDIIMVAAHAGLGPESANGPVPEMAENMVDAIATRVAGIDAIVFGHTHQSLPGKRIGDVLLMQPKNWGISLGRMDFRLSREGNGPWKVVSKDSHLIPVAVDTLPDQQILDIARPYHELAERYLNTPVANAREAMDTKFSRIEDTAAIDAIQQVELDATHADVSFASSFNPNVHIAKGPVTVRQLDALYLYDNELYVIAGSGRMVREALENAARWFLTCQADCRGETLLNQRVIGYNFDMAEGVEYEIDLKQPEGRRIRNLRWHGQPLGDDQPLRIALNNFRAGGSGGYTMFRGAKLLWQSHEDIRDMMVRYYAGKGVLPAHAENNWHVEPAGAIETLEREAIADADRQSHINR